MKPIENSVTLHMVYPTNFKQSIMNFKENDSMFDFFSKRHFLLVGLLDCTDRKIVDKYFNWFKHITTYYLKSRYSIFVDEDDVQKFILSTKKSLLSGIPIGTDLPMYIHYATILNGNEKLFYQAFDLDRKLTLMLCSTKKSLTEEHSFRQICLEMSKIFNKPRKRDPIDTRLRHEIFKRDGYKCIDCGKTKENTTLHADHILPVSQGGTDELENLQTLCQACNLAKSNKKWSRRR